MTVEIWIAVLLENLSARKEEDRAPMNEPNGIQATMRPCVEESGLLK